LEPQKRRIALQSDVSKKSFVRVFFCAKEHLVIFFRRSQWIDAATLKLIELILLDEQTQSILIGLIRDDSDASINFDTRGLRNKELLQDIIPDPLALESLSQLLAEPHAPETVHSLKTVSRKTEGNPSLSVIF